MDTGAKYLPGAVADLVAEVIRARRSIKPADFTEQKIDEADIQRLLEAANWAPTHGRTEPWRFVVFSGDARRVLGLQLQSIYQQATTEATFRAPKYEQLLSNCVRSSHVVSIVMRRQPTGKIPEIEEIEAVACAVQNLHLMATALGIAGYWSSGEPLCSDAFCSFLGFTAPDRVLGLFYLGRPRIDWPAGERGDWRQKVTWHRNADLQVPVSSPE